MDLIKVRKDYVSHTDYRLLTIDKEWLSSQLKDVVFQESTDDAVTEAPSKEPVQPRRAQCGTKRSRVCLVLHGGDQLHVHSREVTDLVRRVEYSNTLLVASRKTSAVAPEGREGELQTSGTGQSSTVRVVQTALSRVFEAHKGVPQTNVLSLLRDSFVTIDELEALPGTFEDASANSSKGSYYSFEQLSRQVACSPVELASALKEAGAVVIDGKVRLVEPRLLHEALRAVLVFIDGSPSIDISWEDVKERYCPDVYPRIVLSVVRAVYGATSPDSEGILSGIHLINSAKSLIGLAGHTFETHTQTQKHVVSITTDYSVEVLTLPFDTFYEMWKDGNPTFLFTSALTATGHSDSLSQLRPGDVMPLLYGYVVCEQHTPGSFVGAEVHWLPRDNLNTNVALRIAALFAVKQQKWSAVELKAYIEPLLVESQTFSHTMLRYAREYRLPGEPVTYASLTR